MLLARITPDWWWLTCHHYAKEEHGMHAGTQAGWAPVAAVLFRVYDSPPRPVCLEAGRSVAFSTLRSCPRELRPLLRGAGELAKLRKVTEVLESA